jgi:hypothetical protein
MKSAGSPEGAITSAMRPWRMTVKLVLMLALHAAVRFARTVVHRATESLVDFLLNQHFFTRERHACLST